MPRIKRLLRRLALWAERRTESWVAGQELWAALDEGRLIEARHLLAKARSQWPNDPALTRAASLLHFIEPD